MTHTYQSLLKLSCTLMSFQCIWSYKCCYFSQSSCYGEQSSWGMTIQIEQGGLRAVLRSKAKKEAYLLKRQRDRKKQRCFCDMDVRMLAWAQPHICSDSERFLIQISVADIYYPITHTRQPTHIKSAPALHCTAVGDSFQLCACRSVYLPEFGLTMVMGMNGCGALSLTSPGLINGTSQN